VTVLWMLLLGCAGREGCDDREVYDHDAQRCVPYSPGDPVAADVWVPPVGTTWQWQLSGRIDTSYDVAMYDIDLSETPDATLAALGDRTVICYFSAGSVEDFRDDIGFIDDVAIGAKLDGWPDERWLDVSHPDAFELARRRLDLAVERGCDGVEPDNVDAYVNGSGFPLSAAEQLQFNRFLADEAHSRGLSVGLKNDVDQLDDLLPWFDWALNEECVSYDECGRYRGFRDADKAVFHTEYVDAQGEAKAMAAEICPARPAWFSTLVKTWDLGPERTTCDD
jgi:hypothetical protein